MKVPIGYPSLRDLVQYVTKMAEEGWDFICITSLSYKQVCTETKKDELSKVIW